VLRVFLSLLRSLRLDTSHYDAIWVVVDRLTKVAHFLAAKTTFIVKQLADLYIKEVVGLHRLALTIVPNRDTMFASKFCHGFQTTMGVGLCFSTTYHPQSDGQSERTIQTLEDMLRACTLDYASRCDYNLSLLEFAYNNNYHASINMALCEALYGR